MIFQGARHGCNANPVGSDGLEQDDAFCTFCAVKWADAMTIVTEADRYGVMASGKLKR
jgi:hypothetical protein